MQGRKGITWYDLGLQKRNFAKEREHLKLKIPYTYHMKDALKRISF